MMTSTWSSAVVSQFEAGRGFALAFTLGGSALSAVIAPSAAAWLIDAFGWRAAYVAIALAVGAIVFLTTWLFFYSRSDRRRSTGGAADVVSSILMIWLGDRGPREAKARQGGS